MNHWSLRQSALLALVLCGLAFTPRSSYAFGGRWHEVVGALADAQLTPRAARWVADLLDGEAQPSLEGVATWADDVKDRSTSRWHYVNLPASCQYDPQRDCRGGQCLVAAIAEQWSILRDPHRSKAERATALKFTTHLIGDLAQPYHNYGGKDGRGGVKTQVRFRGKGTNLHEVWDDEALRIAWGRPSALVSALGASQPVKALPRVSLSDVAAWSGASCRSALAIGDVEPGATVSTQYADAVRTAEETAIAEAARRLAAIVNGSAAAR